MGNVAASRAFIGLVALALWLAPRAAEAGNAAAAEELFNAAKKLKAEGKRDEACEKFQASMDLDPSVGALLNIAECHEGGGKIGSAYSDYQRAVELNRATPNEQRKNEHDQFIREKMRALEPRLPRLTVVVDNAPGDVRVTKNGEEIPRGALGTALPVDPGPVALVATSGELRAEEQVELHEREQKSIHLALAPVSHARAWPWVVGGIGIAAGAAGIVFAVDYGVTFAKLKDTCHGDLDVCRPDDPGFDLDGANARKNRDAALGIAFGATGAALVAAGIAGIATKPSQTGWQLVPQPGALVGLAARARF